MCSPTGWDNRYGLYLDDGWMYVYRSGCLIGRFQLKERSEKVAYIKYTTFRRTFLGRIL